MAESEITNTVTVSGGGITPVTAKETVIAESGPKLTITKSVSPVPVTENGTLTYTFLIQNTGNTAALAATGAVVTDTFDPVLSNLAVSYNCLLYTSGNLPVCGMAAGADMSAISMHKSGGSLTQSSILLTGKAVKADPVRQIINLTQTTSASYLILSSLDISRRNLALRGRESFARVAKMAEYARNEINSIGGYYAYGRDLVNGTSIYAVSYTHLATEKRSEYLRTGHVGSFPALS